MMDHESLRHLADSWGLLLLVLAFVTIVALTFRKGARAHHEEARMIPFREDDGPDPRGHDQ
jgi:cytochrome c oxidase cbb3-type subunit 4